jgi:hypothetical protein
MKLAAMPTCLVGEKLGIPKQVEHIRNKLRIMG